MYNPFKKRDEIIELPDVAQYRFQWVAIYRDGTTIKRNLFAKASDTLQLPLVEHRIGDLDLSQIELFWLEDRQGVRWYGVSPRLGAFFVKAGKDYKVIYMGNNDNTELVYFTGVLTDSGGPTSRPAYYAFGYYNTITEKKTLLYVNSDDTLTFHTNG